MKARHAGGPGHQRDLHPPQRHPAQPGGPARDGQQHPLRGGRPRHVHKHVGIS